MRRLQGTRFDQGFRLVDEPEIAEENGSTMFKIRAAAADDAQGILKIYEPFVQDSLITFEIKIPLVQEIADRVSSITKSYPWKVAVDESGKLIGYAYANKYREREAYQWSTEVSVYVHESFRAKGVASQLYEILLNDLRKLGFYKAYGVITIPNDASIAFHEKFGFRKTAVFPNAGYKLGRWADVGWWELQLRDVDRGGGDVRPPHKPA